MKSPRDVRRAALLLCLLLLLGTGCASRTCVGTPGEPTQPEKPLDTAILDWVAANRSEQELSVLALSGGAANGAFGAGVLKGWRTAGRPDFDVVTGVSTGALISTFAFLNTPAADATLERVFTQLKQSDLFCLRNKLLIPFSSSAATSEGLEKLIDREITPRILNDVATRSQDGKRLLLVSTTNLDSGTRHLWDMGDLARRGDLQTYRRVLLAASSIPGAVPPVYVNGVMHMDGSVVEQVFVPSPRDLLPPGSLSKILGRDFESRPPGSGRLGAGRLNVYVIINGLLREKPECVQPGIFDILGRSLNVALTVKKTDNLWRIYAITTDAGGQFHLMYVPDSHFEDAYDSTAFEPEAMRRLFDVGEQMGAAGGGWLDRPPEIGTDGILTQQQQRAGQAAGAAQSVVPVPLPQPVRAPQRRTGPLPKGWLPKGSLPAPIVRPSR